MGEQLHPSIEDFLIHSFTKSSCLIISIQLLEHGPKWEMMTAHLRPNEENIKRGDDDEFSLASARIENLYFVNKRFCPPDSFLLDNVDKIRHIPTVIVQGRYDVCCPMVSAWDLHKAWPESELKIVQDAAGHSANEPGIAAELVAGNEKLKIRSGRFNPIHSQAERSRGAAAVFNELPTCTSGALRLHSWRYSHMVYFSLYNHLRFDE